MKKILPLIIFLLPLSATSQTVSFYKGEWSVPDKQDLFSCTCKLMIEANGTADIIFIWTYKAIDSVDEVMMKLYKGKKDDSGIEMASGHYDNRSLDVEVTSIKLVDPHVILG